MEFLRNKSATIRFRACNINQDILQQFLDQYDVWEYEWCTFQYNLNYGSRVERARKSRSIPIVQMDIDGNFIREWESSMEAGRNGFTQQGINKCINGKAYQHHGYRWEKLSDYNK